MPEDIQVDTREEDGEIMGSHPLHGSTSGKNLGINIKKNSWYCHRCKSGGGPVEWLAVKAKILQCSDFKKVDDPVTGDKKYPDGNPLLREGVYDKVKEYAQKNGLKLPTKSKKGKLVFAGDLAVMGVGPKGGIKILYRNLATVLVNEFSLKRVISQDTKADLKLAAYDVETGLYKLGGEAQGLINRRCIELLGDNYPSTVKQNLRTYLAAAAQAIEEDDFEPYAHLINCFNGVVDLKTGQLLSWSPDYLQIFQANAVYNPEAKAPKWEKFLQQILPDKKLREYTGLVSGYYITGETKEQIFHIPYGSGNNGKSIWVAVQTSILGSYARQIPISTFIKQKNQSSEKLWTMAQLRGVRWVYAGEPNLGDVLDQSFIKMATGGEKISARFMREGLFEFTPKFKFTLETNDLPGLPQGLTFAMKRRIRIPPFKVQVREEDIIRDLDKKLLRRREREYLPGNADRLKLIMTMKEALRKHLKQSWLQVRNMSRRMILWLVLSDPTLSRERLRTWFYRRS